MTGIDRHRAARDQEFRRTAPDGGGDVVARPIPTETPIAIEIDGIGYAVLMATPRDLDDLVTGFALAERLIDDIDDIIDIDMHDADRGIIIRLTVTPRVADRVVARVRHRTSDSSCGLCGIENLEQALLPLPDVPRWRGEDAAVFRALSAIDALQPINAATRAVHAAVACAIDGTPRLAREDVGRHNAFDKLIGAMARGGIAWDGGFALLTSRCSYELVEKAVLSGCPLLATMSAPTTLAVDRAAASGLALRVLVRDDAMLACP